MEKDHFKKFKAKYKLPSIEEIEEKFEISAKNDSLVLQNIRNEIGFKAYELMKNLESFLFINEGSDPEALFTEQMIREVKTEAHQAYKELNKIHVKVSRIKFEHDRKKDAEFIKSIFKEWDKIEKTLKTVFSAIEKGWKNRRTCGSAYFGSHSR